MVYVAPNCVLGIVLLVRRLGKRKRQRSRDVDYNSRTRVSFEVTNLRIRYTHRKAVYQRRQSTYAIRDRESRFVTV